MRLALLARTTIAVVVSSFVVFGCAAIAGLDDQSGSSSSGQSSGTSGTSGGGEGGVDGVVTFQPESILDFETSACGVGAPRILKIFSNSKNDVEYNVTSSDAVFVVSKNGKGTIRNGAVAEVEVVATANLPKLQETSLTVEVNGRAQPFKARVIGQGATYEPSQPMVDFGDVRKENGGETKIAIKNTGNKTLQTTLEATPPTTDFEIIPSTITANSDQTVEVTVRLKGAATTSGPLTAQFKPKATGICGALPPLDVKGRRITTDVTIDVVDWGEVACKSTPADRDATIKNYGPSTVTFTSALTNASGTFAIKSGGSGMVGGGSETNPAIQKVKLSAVPGTVPGQKDDTLTITYGGGTSTGKVREYVVGLALGISPITSTFSSNGTTEQKRTLNISNNAGRFGSALFLQASYGITGAGFRVENGTTTYYPGALVFPNSSGAVDVVFKATQAGTVNGTFTVNGPVCSQNAVTLTGNNP